MQRAARLIPRLTHRNFCASAIMRGDPWPLPHTPEHLASTSTPEPDPSLPSIEPIRRDNENLDVLIARLTYQSRKRGILETDLLLSTFARDHLPVMTEAEMRQYDKVGRMVGLRILYTDA
jgi:succinate dehydrogenase assembly factor 2